MEQKEDPIRPAIPVGLDADGKVVPDPHGSYTGFPEAEEEAEPDAEDL